MLDRNLYTKSDYEDPAEIICVCYYKSRQQIITAIKEYNLTDVLQVGAKINAGTNCGRCQNRIQEILDKVVEG